MKILSFSLSSSEICFSHSTVCLWDSSLLMGKAIVHSFITFPFSHCLVNDNFGLFHLFLFLFWKASSTIMNSLGFVSWYTCTRASHWIEPGVEFLGPRTDMFSALKDNVKFFSKSAVPIYTPHQYIKTSCWYISCPHANCWLFNVGRSDDCNMIHHSGFRMYFPNY